MSAFFRDFRLIWQYGGQEHLPEISPILLRICSILYILLGPLRAWG